MHSLTSQQLNILKILSCIGGVTHVPLDLFASTYDQFVAVSRDRGLEVDIGILCECGLVILSNDGHKKREWSMKFSTLVVHQMVYWEIPEKLRIAVHKVGGWVVVIVFGFTIVTCIFNANTPPPYFTPFKLY